MRHTLLTMSASVLSALTLSACLSTGGSGFDTAKGLSAAADAVKAVTITDADLQGSSKLMMVEMDAKNPVAAENDKYSKRLANLTKDLANEDGLNLNFKAYLVKDVNAFATPDGSVRVYAGLMDMMTDDELRSVIGHEIGHVKLGHSMKRARTSYLSSAASKAADAQGLSSKQLIDLGLNFAGAQYSQSNEFEADAYGVEFLKRHNYNLPAAESAMRKLAKLASSGGISSLFSSHPDTEKRADRIHELISK